MTHKPLINASLSCIDLGNIEHEMKLIQQCDIHVLHYDIVDGIFNHCFMFGDLMLKTFRHYTYLPIVVHLACDEPLRYVEPIIQNGADYVAIHYESHVDVLEMFKRIRQLGAKPILAFRCDTPVPNDFITYASQAEWVLKLTVHPGFSGQPFHMEALQHIQTMHQMLELEHLLTPIEADGNITVDTIALCARAGATIFTGGTSGLFNSSNSLDNNIKRLQQAFQEEGGMD